MYRNGLPFTRNNSTSLCPVFTHKYRRVIDPIGKFLRYEDYPCVRCNTDKKLFTTLLGRPEQKCCFCCINEDLANITNKYEENKYSFCTKQAPVATAVRSHAATAKPLKPISKSMPEPFWKKTSPASQPEEQEG